MIVVLFQPKIPQNTGNIARTCAAVGCQLRLVPPCGFSLCSAKLKRAGLDYWPQVDCRILTREDLERGLLQEPDRYWFFTSKASRRYDRARYSPRDRLVFGSETSGLPAEWLSRFSSQTLVLPKRESIRCLNLSTAVGIGVYEAWRQSSFAPMPLGDITSGDL